MSLSRKPMKRSQPKRDWSYTEFKRVECRVPNCSGWPVELAHTIGREKQDKPRIGPRGGQTLYVNPDAVVPLCLEHHRQHHAHQLDLLRYLSEDEQENAFRACDRSIALAYRRLTGVRDA